MREITIRMRPPGLADRLWCKRLGLRLPVFTGSSGPRSAKWFRLLVPYRWRPVHHAYADLCGFYWLPCPVCGVPFGGHEGGGHIPDAAPVNGGSVVCSKCTRAGLAS